MSGFFYARSLELCFGHILIPGISPLFEISRLWASRVFGSLAPLGSSRLWREEGAKCYEQWLDDAQANWPIPDERMKKRRQHTVPLCNQALTVLDDMKSVSEQYEHIFISLRKPQTPINSQTANMAIRRMGYKGKLVSHGLRALASTVMNEEGKDPDLIESALAHGDPNQVRSAYNRAQYLGRRRELMQWWGEYLDEAFNKHKPGW